MNKAARKKPSFADGPPETFKPFALQSPDTWITKLAWRARMLADLQAASICDDLLPHLQHAKGCVVDIGCGDMPYRHLARQELQYVGFDVAHAQQVFGYNKKGVEPFDGKVIPMPDNSADLVLCTEVLEHHPAPQPLIQEMYRVAKPGAKVVATVPWSARMHYLPEDYHRYSSRTLRDMFAAFATVDVTARGTDVTAICNKLMVVFMRSAAAVPKLSAKGCMGTLALGWAMPMALAFGQLSLRGHVGSANDPLGFTVVATK